jgi:hypothetical protein
MPSSVLPGVRGPLAERLIWTLLLGSSVVYFFWTNEADNDLWGHVFFGRTILATRMIPRVDAFAYTAAGRPWVDHEWLSQVVMGTLTPSVRIRQGTLSSKLSGSISSSPWRRP